MINSAIRKSPFAVSDERAFCFELLGVLHRARFANDVDANLTRILHFLLDALGNFLGENLRAIVGHVVGLDHDAHFAAGLNRVALLDAGEGGCNLFQLLQTLDVVFEALTARTRTSSGNRVRRLNQHGFNRLRFDVVVVGEDAVDDIGALVVLAGQFAALLAT